MTFFSEGCVRLARVVWNVYVTLLLPRRIRMTKALYSVLVTLSVCMMAAIYFMQQRSMEAIRVPESSGSVPQLFAVHMKYGSIDENGLISFDKPCINCSQYSNITWTNPHLDLLHLEPYKFLPNFKNPCWYEPLTDYDVYRNNKYNYVSRSARVTSLKLIKEWSKRLANDVLSRRLRCMPYFIIIGQPKCGSTDLFQRIVMHPEVKSPPIKELHWWSRNRQGRNINYTDIIPIQQYIDMFDMAARHIEMNPSIKGGDTNYEYVTGEASVSYLWENDDWFHYRENLNLSEPLYTNADYCHHFLPKAKLIVILRDPVDRLYSDYLYFTKGNKSAEDFHSKVVFGIETMKNCTKLNTLRHCVYNRTIAYLFQVRLRLGLYELYIRDWMRVYPKEQFFFIRLEDYSQDIRGSLKKVYEFLELSPLTKAEIRKIFKHKIANKRKFKDKKVGKMLNETRLILNRFYDRFNRRLSRLLGDKRFLWNSADFEEEEEDEDDDYYYGDEDDNGDDGYEDGVANGTVLSRGVNTTGSSFMQQGLYHVTRDLPLDKS